MTNEKNNKLSLEKALQSYRVYSAPSTMSWKQHYVNEVFSNVSLIECTKEEQEKFFKRLQESKCTICDNIKFTSGSSKDFSNLIKILTNESYKDINKTSRKVIYSTSNGERPIGNKAYSLWNGFQVIDLDIKDKIIANKLKKGIFESLCKCNWFLGVVLSSSGKGLHVYTKITISEENSQKPLDKQKLLYLTNFRHKFSFVYIACLKYCEVFGFTKEDLRTWMDLSMFKPQQGAFIGYDSEPLISTNYFEDFIYISFDSISDIGCPEVDWVSHPDLKSIFQRWEWFEDPLETPKINILDDGSSKNIESILNNNSQKIHYKHTERWKLANTLVRLYGLENGYKYLRNITSPSVSDKELRADCVTASRHNKDVDPWAINCLNSRHGFKIKVNIENPEITQEELFIKMDSLDNPNNITCSNNYIEFKINKRQYLGDITNKLVKNFGKITLLEAGPGLGKTEMIKSLVDKHNKKIMMVMPFTSTIKSKVEEDPGWYYSYGNKKPKLDVECGLALTLDKFSRLNPMDIAANNFDYVVIDESHLLFMSDYRDIMSRCVDMIKILEVPVILMSGTPTGELVFFENITHIKVIKEETRKKDLDVTIIETPNELLYHMCKEMAFDISQGKRILYPSNEGTSHSKRIEAGINYFLKNEFQFFKDINLKYYKKSQVGEDFMDLINFKKTIKNIDVLMCTSYLSVGVDILDKLDFNIYFSNLCTASEADQWSNRLRSNDLHIKLYISKTDHEGNSRNINTYKPMNFKLSPDELMDMHSIIRICNESIERSPVVSQYNPLISSIIHSNNYIVFNEITQQYYIDETAYKITQFEKKYREFAQQLPVFLKGMQSYGYSISAHDIGITDITGSDIFRNLKNTIQCANERHRDWNTNDIEELISLITYDRLDIYKDALKGKYEIRKSKEWKEDFNKNIIYCKNVEMFDKVVPIFLSLSKHFDIPEVREIFGACKKHKRYNFAALTRFRSLFNLINANENKRLDLPIHEFMEDAYKLTEKETITKKDYQNFIQRYSRKYAQSISTVEIIVENSQITMKRISDIFDRIFKCLVEITYKKNEMKLKRVEILWQTREKKFYNPGCNLLIDSFLDSMISVEEVSLETYKNTIESTSNISTQDNKSDLEIFFNEIQEAPF